jgi:hypothetical protein
LNQLIENITGYTAGTPASTMSLLTVASFVIIAVGQVFLARRNDLGWWVLMLGFFVGPVAISLYPGQSNLWTLMGALPLFACAAVGMYGFSRSELVGRFTRRVHNQRFSVVSTIGLLILAFVLTLLQFGQSLTSPKVIFSADMLVPWLSYGFTALIAAGFVGIGFGARWAWFFPALGSLGLAVYTATHPAQRPDVGLFVYLFAYVLVLLTSLYGVLAWGSSLPAKSADAEGDAEAEPVDEASGIDPRDSAEAEADAEASQEAEDASAAREN